MNGNDHTDCPVELRACPEHENQPIAEGRPLPEGVVEIKFPADWRHETQPSCECGCSEIDAAEGVGWHEYSRQLHCGECLSEPCEGLEKAHAGGRTFPYRRQGMACEPSEMTDNPQRSSSTPAGHRWFCAPRRH